MCHTDAFTLSGDDPEGSFPCVLGHEGGCEVVELGAGVKGRTELPGYVERYMNGTIELDSLVTHTLPLEEINTAFDLMHSGKSIRSVIIF